MKASTVDLFDFTY